MQRTVSDKPNTTTRLPFTRDEKTLLVVYLLHLVGFVIPPLWLIAIITNHVKRGELFGSWLESHNRWQMRTFWFGLAWLGLGSLTSLLGIGFIILFANSVWVLYRVIKGLLNLYDRKDVYHPNLSYAVN